jgi:hypothetical protein
MPWGNLADADPVSNASRAHRRIAIGTVATMTWLRTAIPRDQILVVDDAPEIHYLVGTILGLGSSGRVSTCTYRSLSIQMSWCWSSLL